MMARRRSLKLMKGRKKTREERRREDGRRRVMRRSPKSRERVRGRVRGRGEIRPFSVPRGRVQVRLGKRVLLRRRRLRNNSMDCKVY
jgi:hypothetical protein